MTGGPEMMKMARALSGVMVLATPELSPAERVNVMAAAVGMLYSEAFFPRSLHEDGNVMECLGYLMVTAALRRTSELMAAALSDPEGSA